MFRSSSEICTEQRKNRPAAGALLLLLAVLFALCLAPAQVSADAGYTTDAFNVEITTDQDHTFHVSEEIQVDFSAPRHGIYRDIPLGGRYYGVQNVRVYGYDYTSYEEGNALVIQIGSADYTVTGVQNYRISYDIVGYRDDDETKDMLSLDLLPTGWATPIQSSRITMTLPSPVEGLKFYSGAYGEAESADANFTIRQDGATITAASRGILPQGEGLTVKADLPEGYWVDPYSRDDDLPWMYGALGALGMLMLLLWLFVGRDDPIIPTVEFYPPDDMDPLETAYVGNDRVAVKDLSALFMYFANKGYVRIEQTDRKRFRIVRLKDPDLAEQKHAREVFHALFSEGNTVDMRHLPGDLGELAPKITAEVKQSFQGKKRSFSAASLAGRAAGLFCCLLIPFLAAAFTVFLTYGDFSMITAGLVGTIVIFASMVSLVAKTDAWRSNKKPVRVFIGFLLLMAGILMEAMAIARSYPIMALIFMLSVLAAAIATIFVRRRMNNELFGKVLGFRDFIKTAEYDRLKMLSDEDPEYYFNILPYAYIFGMSTKWAEKFADFHIDPPRWYASSTGTFDPMFGHHMFVYTGNGLNSAVASHYKAVGESMLSSDSLSSGGGGGGFGGGGFSGGGFGGGGGGAW